jgi:uncharacterized protein GlcG (DUF336 family)
MDNIPSNGALVPALAPELFCHVGAVASSASDDDAVDHGHAAAPTPSPLSALTQHLVTSYKTPHQANRPLAALGTGAGAAASISAAVPPLKLLQALPGATSAATAAVTSPAQPARVSYQLSDSHGALHLVTSAEEADAHSIATGPYPASAAATAAARHSALQAAAEQPPWTQNTARALCRTQQEVAELCAAGGLPLPAERAYCFDLVGTLLTTCACWYLGSIRSSVRR